jgi:hypothetical protein
MFVFVCMVCKEKQVGNVSDFPLEGDTRWTNEETNIHTYLLKEGVAWFLQFKTVGQMGHLHHVFFVSLSVPLFSRLKNNSDAGSGQKAYVVRNDSQR